MKKDENIDNTGFSEGLTSHGTADEEMNTEKSANAENGVTEDDNETVLTSASARILAATQEESEQNEPDESRMKEKKSGFFENFWYHYKWTAIISFFFIAVGIFAVFQMVNREKADVNILYAGPEYISSDSYDSFREAVKTVMSDYNGDGEKGLLFTALTCMTSAQIDEKYKQAAESGIVDFYIDREYNASEYKKFQMNVFAGEHVILFLDPELYVQVKESGGLVPLNEVIGEIPECALYEYGIRFSQTEFYKFFTGAQIMPDDTVLCARRVSTMTAFRKSKKAEKIHGYHMDMFRDIVGFSLN